MAVNAGECIEIKKERGRPRSFLRRVQLPFAVSRSSTRRAKASMEQSSTVSPGRITRSKKQLGISRLRSSFSMHREQPWSWFAGWHRHAVLRQGQKGPGLKFVQLRPLW